MEKNKKNEELQSRREFFKKAAKGALPILAAVTLASAPQLSKAAEVMGCGSGCKSYCSAACQTTCKGACDAGCGGSCGASCTNGCKNGCKRVSK